MGQATLQFQGSLTLQAPAYPPSAAVGANIPFSEVNYLQNYDIQSPTLSADGATSIPFPIGMASCNFIYLKIQPGGSPVDLALTTADGTLQVVPVDSLYIGFFTTKAVTAIQVTRTLGVSTTITYVIGQNQ